MNPRRDWSTKVQMAFGLLVAALFMSPAAGLYWLFTKPESDQAFFARCERDLRQTEAHLAEYVSRGLRTSNTDPRYSQAENEEILRENLASYAGYTTSLDALRSGDVDRAWTSFHHETDVPSPAFRRLYDDNCKSVLFP